MNAVMRIVKYPKGRGTRELSIFSIDEFNVDYQAKSVWYRNRICEQVLKPDHIHVDYNNSPSVITVGYDAKEEA